MGWIPGGTFLMGLNDHYPEEAAAHSVTIDGFWLEDGHPHVTNAEFGRIVKATGYVTVAERELNPDGYPDAEVEMLVPGSVIVQPPRNRERVDLRCPTWWTYGARRKLATS